MVYPYRRVHARVCCQKRYTATGFWCPHGAWTDSPQVDLGKTSLRDTDDTCGPGGRPHAFQHGSCGPFPHRSRSLAALTLRCVGALGSYGRGIPLRWIAHRSCTIGRRHRRGARESPFTVAPSIRAARGRPDRHTRGTAEQARPCCSDRAARHSRQGAVGPCDPGRPDRDRASCRSALGWTFRRTAITGSFCSEYLDPAHPRAHGRDADRVGARPDPSGR